MNNSSQVRKSGDVLLIKEELKKSDEQSNKNEEVKKPLASDGKDRTDVKPATESKQHDST